MVDIGFDILSDLRLDPNETFNWENKATSLYCVLAGNVTHNMRTLWQTLGHLSKFYQGIFYIPGPLEYISGDDVEKRTADIQQIVSRVPNVALLHQHVVIIDGIAILGCNGWEDENPNFQHLLTSLRLDDVAYLNKSIDRLQRHIDVKKILVVSSAVPKKELYFGLAPPRAEDTIHLDFALGNDTEHKVSHWAFGTTEKIVDTTIGNINYINNPYFRKLPYWPKRISIKV